MLLNNMHVLMRLSRLAYILVFLFHCEANIPSKQQSL